METFLEGVSDFIRMMPDCRPSRLKAVIAAKSAVAYPGCHFPADMSEENDQKDDPPLVIWNHRWEHDKNPEAFFDALSAVRQCGIDFRVAVLGESYMHIPPVFDTAKERLNDCIVQWGYVPARQDYYQWLRRGHVVVSTAHQENFGISVVEAVRHGCLPLLPNRLCYPELLPEDCHADFLFENQTDLEEKLSILLTGKAQWQDKQERLASHMAQFAWEKAIGYFDEELTKLAENRQNAH
jgi:glycosyltransferase involved in cell wall biosynthesis